MRGWLEQQHPPRAGAGMPPRRKSRISTKPFAVRVGIGVSLRAAIGEPNLRRRLSRSILICPSAGQGPDGLARVAGTRRPHGATAAINRSWSCSPRNPVAGWARDRLITDFARFINSEIALLCGWRGAATHRDLLVGSGGTYQEIARALEGGVVGRALHLPLRAALEPLDRYSGDRRVGARAPARAERATTRRRGRRPRAWGEARGSRPTQSRPLRSRTRGAA